MCHRFSSSDIKQAVKFVTVKSMLKKDTFEECLQVNLNLYLVFTIEIHNENLYD